MTYLKLALKFGPWIASAILAVLLWTSYTAHGATKTELSSATNSLRSAEASLLLSAKAIADRDTALVAQNESLENLRVQAEDQRKRYAVVVQEARQVTKQNDVLVQSLLDLKGPEGELEQCRAARELILKELEL